MNTLLHAIKAPTTGGIIVSFDHAQQGVPETLTLRDFIKPGEWFVKRLLKKGYMSTIDDFPIPDFICQYFHELIDVVPDVDIQALARLDPELCRGIRASRKNVKLIRQRMRAMLANSGVLDISLAVAVRRAGFNQEFIAVLSKEMLELFIPELVKFYGAARTLGSMLVDERSEVRKLAINFLTSQNGQELEDSGDNAGSVLAGDLQPFLSHIKPLLSKDTGPAITSSNHKHPDKEAGNNNRKIKELNAKLKKIDKDGQRIKKTMNDKIGRKDAQIKTLQEQLDREKGLRREADKNVKSLKNELAGIEKQLQQKIDREVERRMNSNIRSWLVEPRKIEEAAQKLSRHGEDDIRGRAAGVLREQEKIDRHYGNRRLLRQHLSELEELLQQISDAGREALNPLPALAAMRNELTAEIDSIRKSLDEPPLDMWRQKVESLVNQAASQTEFNQIRKLLTGLKESGIINNNDQLLDNLYNDRLARLYEKYSPRAAGKSRSAVQLIHDWQKTEGSFILVVDGYNVILSLPELFGADYEEDGRPGAEARHHLLHIIDGLLGDSDCLAEVFFDGEEAGQRNFSPQVREIFSGGGDRAVANRADTAIIDYLSSLPPTQERVQIVVSDDRELQALARNQRAGVMPLAQFAVLVR